TQPHEPCGIRLGILCRGAGRVWRPGGRNPRGTLACPPRARSAWPGAQAVTPKRKRLYLLLRSLAVLGIAAALVLSALNENLVFFYSPTQVADKNIAPERRFRLGGRVEAGSVKKNGQEVRFTVTDTHKTVQVVYRGLLPDLFREGQGVVAEGSLGPDGVFVAHEVLAKHDENYMPPQGAKAIQEAGQGREKQ